MNSPLPALTGESIGFKLFVSAVILDSLASSFSESFLEIMKENSKLNR